jgi:hypothetical protein
MSLGCTCLRCFEGRVYDIERGAWVACERCSGSGRVIVYVYPKLRGSANRRVAYVPRNDRKAVEAL